MGNIVDALVANDTSEVDGLWVTVQNQSKEIRELREFIANMGLTGSLPEQLRSDNE